MYRCTIYRKITGRPRHYRFETLREAEAFTREVFDKTGVILGIEEERTKCLNSK